MNSAEVRRAVGAATVVATSLGLTADESAVLHNSNNLALLLLPCEVLVRVTRDPAAARLELERARLLDRAGCPVGVVDPRVDPMVHTRDRFALTFWVYYEPVDPGVPAVDYALGLRRLHSGMRAVEAPIQSFRDRIAQADRVVSDSAQSPELNDEDRAFLSRALADTRQAVDDFGAPEQLLHGEPHPGNVLATVHGPLFIDFETLCRGPVEFDLAHVPDEVCEAYAGMNRPLLDECRHLVLAMVAAWRWQVEDEYPNGRRWGREFLRTLRAGPPWPTLDALTRRMDGG